MRDHASYREPRSRRSERGLTLLELLIVIAIIAVGLVVFRSSLSILGNFGLSEDADELAAMLRRASQLSVERGEQHRVVFDLERGAYRVDVCAGAATLARNEQTDADKEKVEQAVQKGQDRLRDLPQDALTGGGDPEGAVTRAKALAGHHVGDRVCTPAQGGVSGISHSTIKKNLENGDQYADWARALDRKVKISEIWVQHKDGSTKKGDVAIYFFPNGSAEKAIIELTDGDSVRTLLVHGLTGQVQQRTGKLDDPDDHMLRNVMGDKDKLREVDR